MPEPPLRTVALITAPLGPRAFRAELPNGKPVVAHLPARAAGLAGQLSPGTRAQVEISPYDLDRARITAIVPDAGTATTGSTGST